MISIIVCSRIPKVDDSYANNIKGTIGNVSYELIWIDNSQNQYSIFEAYNKGVGLSNGEYLCFAHEDIVYHSKDWGRIVCDVFAQNTEVGMLGLVGGHVLTPISTCWWATDRRRGALRQGLYRNGVYETHMLTWTKSEDKDKFVVSVDGVWMVIRRDLFRKICFDADTYSGFHFYDMDISMQINNLGYKIMIVEGIDVEHKSTGKVNASFYRNCIAFHNKWDSMLPVFSFEPTAEDIQIFNVPTFKRLLYQKVYFPLSAYLFKPTRFIVKAIANLQSKLVG